MQCLSAGRPEEHHATARKVRFTWRFPLKGTKRQRQALILEIVRHQAVSSQFEIVDALAERGVTSNQATVSRDLKDLGLVRAPDRDGRARYVAPAGNAGRTWEDVSDLLSDHVSDVDWNPLLVVLKTDSGAAHMVGVAVDSLREPDIVGTVAGDDTLLVVPRSEAARERLVARFHKVAGG
jgi:transcriptional regulator of arginine metabolism